MIGTGLAAFSDVNLKKDVGTFADGYQRNLSDAYGLKPADDPYAGIDPFDPGGALSGKPSGSDPMAAQQIIKPAFDTSSHFEKAKAAGSTIENAATKEQENKGNTAAGIANIGLGALTLLSDEEAKQEVERMGKDDRVEWAHKVEPITFRYKPGVTEEDDGGARAGVSAQQLESTGGLGRLMVHKDPYSGMRKVDGLALGLMMGKAALDRADEAVAIAQGKKKKGGR